MKTAVVVPWVTDAEIESFLSEWKVSDKPEWLVLQRDEKREGCGVTKNKGIAEAMRRNAEIVVVLDGDCYPTEEAPTLENLMAAHLKALEPQQVLMFDTVTEPASRGTPYAKLTIEMPVAASMGFWTQVGDYCAVRQLAHAGTPMTFKRETIHGKYFPLCGMNVAFNPWKWRPWCDFINVSRFDDIWMGWLFEREAYRRGHCFNLNGPLIRHARQSNVWRNLHDEVKFLLENEVLWMKIATAESNDYETLRKLLPV